MRLGFAIALVLIVLVLLILFGGNKKDLPSQNQTISEEFNEQATDNEKSLVQTPQASSINEELCEYYEFNEGQSRTIDSHEIIVERISKNGIKIYVDKEDSMVFEGDNDLLGDGIRIELYENKIIYFDVDDIENTVSLRVGCENKNEDSRDKYVRDKGNTFCEATYKDCKESFLID